jgi:hypothetical protein
MPLRAAAVGWMIASVASQSAASCDKEKGPVPSGLQFGAVDCSCIQPVYANRSTEAIQQGVDESTYGRGACVAWDSNTPTCGGNTCASNDKAPWCYSAWCYVDPYKCNRDWQLSDFFPSSGRAFSYAACGELNSYSSQAAGEAAVNALRGRVLRVGRRGSTGGWRGAYHADGKSRLSPTPETGWYGPLSDLFDDISTTYNITFQVTAEPDDAYTRSPSSNVWDNCVYAVAIGSLDLCIGAFSVTTLRSSWANMLTYETVPTFLVVPATKAETTLEKIERAFLPFSWDAWGIILAFLVATGALFFLLELEGIPQEQQFRSTCSGLAASTREGVQAFMGYASVGFTPTTPSGKLLLVGFGFFM